MHPSAQESTENAMQHACVLLAVGARTSARPQVSEVHVGCRTSATKCEPIFDDDCFYYHSSRNNVVIAFGTL